MRTRARKTWVAAGVVIVVGTLIRVAQLEVVFRAPVEVVQVLTVTADLLTAVGLLLLAVGLRRSESVVDRRPGGLFAMFVFAVWPLAAALIAQILPAMNQATYDVGLQAYRAAESALTAFWVANILVPLFSSLAASLSILRSPTVPRRWRWAPLAIWTLSLLLGCFTYVLFAAPLFWLVNVAPLAFVGLVSIVAGSRVGAGRDSASHGERGPSRRVASRRATDGA